MNTRWYWLIECSNTVKKPYMSGDDDLHGVDDWLLRIGKRIESWNPDSWIRCTKPQWDGDPDDSLQNHLGIPIYSIRLQELIREAGFSGIQFLPIRVLRRAGREIPGFAVANILNMPSAMDMHNSKFDRYGDDYFHVENRGKIAGVYKMVLKRGALHGQDIIRVKEFCISIYASERLKLKFEAANYTGYSFEEIELT